MGKTLLHPAAMCGVKPPPPGQLILVRCTISIMYLNCLSPRCCSRSLELRATLGKEAEAGDLLLTYGPYGWGIAYKRWYAVPVLWYYGVYNHGLGLWVQSNWSLGSSSTLRAAGVPRLLRQNPTWTDRYQVHRVLAGRGLQ